MLFCDCSHHTGEYVFYFVVLSEICEWMHYISYSHVDVNAATYAKIQREPPLRRGTHSTVDVDGIAQLII